MGVLQVIAEDTRAKRELGISGVPHFVVAAASEEYKQRSRQLGGAQPSQQFLDAFAHVMS